MKVSACPECRRVFDGKECLACGYEAPKAMPPPPPPDDDAIDEAAFFDSGERSAEGLAVDDADRPTEVVEDLSVGELLMAKRDVKERLELLAEFMENEGKMTEAQVLKKARAVLLNPQAAMIKVDGESRELGALLVDGNEDIPDDTAVVEDLPLGELLRYKARLSTKVGYIADFVTDEGKVAEGEILYEVRDILRKLDAAKTELDQRL